MKIENPLRCILYWLILVVIMILHFNYHVGELFYGIEITREGANGHIPIGTHIIRNIFYHLPLVWVIFLIFTDAKLIRAGLFFISIIYALAHGLHLFKDLSNPDLSQTPLLSLALTVSILLCFEHYNFWKSRKNIVENL